MKVLTEVWCIDPDAIKMNEELGSKVKDEGDTWLPYAFEILDARSIKKAGDHEFLNRGEATTVTFHNGESVTIRLSFQHVYELWEKASEDVREVSHTAPGGKPMDQLTVEEANALGLQDDDMTRPEELHWSIKIRRLLLLRVCPTVDTEQAEQIGRHNALLRDFTAMIELAYRKDGSWNGNADRLKELIITVNRMFDEYIKQPNL